MPLPPDAYKFVTPRSATRQKLYELRREQSLRLEILGEGWENEQDTMKRQVRLVLYADGKVESIIVPRSPVLTSGIAYSTVDGPRNDCKIEARLGGYERHSGTS